MYPLIDTAQLNDVDPRAWLADVLARLPDHPARRIEDLLPWNCASHRTAADRPIHQAAFRCLKSFRRGRRSRLLRCFW
jgi:hypothetical protein